LVGEIQVVALVVQAHQIVKKGRAAVDHQDLTADTVEEAAAQRQDGVRDLLLADELALHVKPLREGLEVPAEGGPQRLGAHEPRTYHVEPNVLIEKAIGEVAAKGLHHRLTRGDEIVVLVVMVWPPAREPDDIAGVATETLLDLRRVLVHGPSAVLDALPQ